MRMKQVILLLLSTVTLGHSFGQKIRINEVMASNSQTILDEDGDASDWIELYNFGSEPINLLGYGLTDKSANESVWTFPDYDINPEQYLLVFASNKNRLNPPQNWGTLIDLGDEWKYLVPNAEPTGNWRVSGFDDSSWGTGTSGFGYGDNDDNTTVDNGTISIFIRKTFNISDLNSFTKLLLHMDYDDGFVAYINGVEVARRGLVGTPPTYNETSSDHEAVIKDGGTPEAFDLIDFQNYLIEGENVMAVEVHNTGTSSSDMTIIPILSAASTVNLGLEVSDFLSQSQSSFHTDFKISSTRDSIFLVSPSKTFIDTMIVFDAMSDFSYGWNTEGSELVYFPEPTPGQANDTNGYNALSGEISYSHSGGIYANSIQVTIENEGEIGQIYYTTDGSIPTDQSIIYTAPIDITTSTSLRSRVMSDLSLPGKVNTATYLINVSHDTPVISLSVDPYEFFDPVYGMYEKGPNASADFPYFGANFWEDWERAVHVEMIETNGDLAFSIDAGVNIFGAYSRGNDQKSLALHFRKSYEGSLMYKVFPSKDLEEFSSLVLRNSGNDWNNTMMRDGLMTSLFHKSVDKQAFRAAALYINGQYWGIQNIREKLNEHFLANNHNIKSSDIQIVETYGSPVFGSEENYLAFINYVSNNDLSVKSKYDYVKSQMDIDNFIYYFTGNIFINNTDWPGNNIKFWRENSPEGRWRWIAYDTDFGFGIWDSQDYSYNTLDFALNPNGPGWPNPPWSTLLFRKLMANADFKNRFINLYADQLNTSFKTDAIKTKIDAMSGAIENEIPKHMSRWGGSFDGWKQQINNYHTYALNRPSYAKNHIKSRLNLAGEYELGLSVSSKSQGTIRVNSLNPTNFPWTGTYFNEIPIEVEAIPNAGFRFVRWEGGSTSESANLNMSFNQKTSLKAIFEASEIQKLEIVINEINYSSSEEFGAKDWVELFNKGNQSVDLSNWVLKDDDDKHEFVFPENTRLGSKGYLLLCNDLKDFQSHYKNEMQTIGDFDFGLSGKDCIRIFDQKGELVDEVCYLSDVPWPSQANGKGATLALNNALLDNSLPENWHANSNNGNPGIENNSVEVLSLIDSNIYNQVSVFPNPFTHNTNISFNLTSDEHIQIEIINVNGQRLALLANGMFPQGRNTIAWETETTSGIYLMKLTRRNYTVVKRLILR